MTAPKVNRGTRNMRGLKKTFRTECEAANEPCWLCGQAIDYTAPPETADAFEYDHFHPVSTHPQLAEDPANARASHSSCNRSRGDTDPADLLTVGQQSRTW